MNSKADVVYVDSIKSDVVKILDSVNDLAGRVLKLETPVKESTAMYFPWYSRDMRLKAVEIAQANPTVSFLFTANPNSGPGTLPRLEIQENIRIIKEANNNVKILGYVFTKYGARSLAEIKADVDKYKDWYDVDGIMWDEVSSNISTLAYYTEITNYARSKGLSYIRGNPGNAVPEQFIQLFDVTSINENSSLLSETQLKVITYNGKYKKEKFNYLAHSISSLDTTWFKMACNYVGSIYITDKLGGDGNNPWSLPASYLQQEIDLLK